jgi:RND family efflux transporter MFP subunit
MSLDIQLSDYKVHYMRPVNSIGIIGLSALERLTLLVAGLALSFQVMAEDSPFKYSPIPAVDCVINPNQVVDLASPVPGVIEALHVERSQQVTAGQVVAQLEAGVERANVDLALYRSGIQSEISLGKTNLDYDKRRLSRLDELYQKQVISTEITEEAEREAELSRLNLEQARELAVVRKLELQVSREQLRQKSIRAPFDGFVLDTYKYKGEYVEDQAILRLAQFDPLVIEAIVPMDNFGEITPGMMAEILPEFDADETLTGEVTIVDRMGDTASNTFGVRMVLPNPENKIPAGLKCVAKFLDPLVHHAPASTAQQDNHQTLPDDATAKADLRTGVMTASASSVPLIDAIPAAEPVTDFDSTAAQTNETVPTGYVVATAQAETAQLTQDLLNRLREAGVRDLQEVDHGRYKGMILLGYYTFRDYAEKRQTALAELGFTSEIYERY